MPAGRNTKGQNGQDHEPNVPGGGWMHENFRVLRWPGRSFFLTSPFIGPASAIDTCETAL